MSGPATYTIQDWVFRDAAGRYEIDLGDSNAPCLTVGDIADASRVVLDYGSDRGSARLREQVAALYRCPSREVGIAHGAQEALYLIYRALLRPDDHVIAFKPGWAQSWNVPARIGCALTVLQYTRDFDLDLEAIAQAIRPNTRALVLNVPCNPTGRGITDDDRRHLIAMLRARRIHLIADEEYLQDFGESFVHDYEQAVSVSSLSKLFGAPGLRVGWMCGPKEIVAAAMAYKHETTISNSVLCESLASAVLVERDHYLRHYRALIGAGSQILREWVRRHAGEVELVEPQGAPFCWLHLRSAEPSLEFCRRVLIDTRVLTMPAEVFDRERGMRLTFAREAGELREGLRRIASQFTSQVA
ncbi:pyridoxal phosphate-dependent aminotransferase [Paraburkholderia sp. 31.1]|uniref:pyridoxal phosphate-dependent aminotransferase n=1 Tax=Paraburkholderia sp. 31.1 TaxID=2615205 RepID=UPI0016563DE1|nr:pyridoxal phosphate-dependent aminotransferase [Paraburkholderia sp. 31.1]MBC8724650.1 pyridoxal phosphate-dependent aminotransferase [Paraburkholderia sp. 31.1]